MLTFKERSRILRKNLFDKNIEPLCKYCSNSTELADNKFLICGNRGVVEVDYSCKKFKYNPLKRVPKLEPKLQQFNKEDFEL